MIWYESPKSRNARVYINTDLEKAMEFLSRLTEDGQFDLRPNFDENSAPEAYFVDLLNVISSREEKGRLAFKEEIDLDDCIRKLVPEHRSSYNLVVQRHGSHLYEERVHEEDGEAKVTEKQIEQFLSDATPVDMYPKKEMRFVAECGMNRELIRDLDIGMREELEKIFPVLRNYNILVFKAKRNTMRRAQIYPNEGGYTKYIEVMKQFLADFNGKYIPKLESKMKVVFRGKYIIKIDEDTWRNFMNTILAYISKYQLT